MFRTQEKGQGLVEYSLILVLVSIVVIGVLLILGPSIGNVFTKININLNGIDGGGSVIVTPVPTHSSQTVFDTWEELCAAHPGERYSHQSDGRVKVMTGGAHLCP
jgi:pilus assembly protein Flp/PilA